MLIFLIKIQEYMVTGTIPSPYIEGMTDAAATTDPSGDTGASSSDTYQEYSPNNALILSQKNAGNIQFLKTRVDNLDTTNAKFTQYIFDISNNLTTLNDQVNTIIEQQAQYAQAVAPNPAPTASMDLSMPADTTTTTSGGGS